MNGARNMHVVYNPEPHAYGSPARRWYGCRKSVWKWKRVNGENRL